MGKINASDDKFFITDPSLEFDIFEMARQRLVEVFVAGGHDLIEAEKIALHVVAGLRPVPKLLQVLMRNKAPTRVEILETLGPVLDEAIALDKAKRMLLHMNVEQSQFLERK